MNKLTQPIVIDPWDDQSNIDEILQEKVYPGSHYQFIMCEYQILDIIGSGAFGSVYLCRDAVKKIEVALKIINIDRILSTAEQQLRNKTLELINRQYYLMQSCDSPNVVKCYKMFQNRHCKMYILEYCSNQNLQNYLERNNWCLQEEQAIGLLKQICLGVAELHKRKIIHRDLKLQNIMFCNGIIKIIDLGLGKQLEKDFDLCKNTYAGTAQYMAPEIIQRQPYGIKVDIFAIGVIYLKMICSNKQLSKRSPYLIYNNFEVKQKSGKSISRQSLMFLKHTLSKKAEERPDWIKLLNDKLFEMHTYLSPSYIKSVEQRLKDFQSSAVELDVLNDLQFEPSQEEQGIFATFKIVKSKVNDQTYFLQYKKAEFILKQIVNKLQKPEYGFDCNCKQILSLLYLLTQRAFLDINHCLYECKQTDSLTYFHQIQILELQAKRKYNYYTKKLNQNKSQIVQKVKYGISKLFHTQNKEKQQIMVGIEGTDYTREEQIGLIIKQFNNVVVNIQIQQLRTRIMAFNSIMALTLNDIKQNSLDNRIKDIIQSYSHIKLSTIFHTH